MLVFLHVWRILLIFTVEKSRDDFLLIEEKNPLAPKKEILLVSAAFKILEPVSEIV